MQKPLLLSAVLLLCWAGSGAAADLALTLRETLRAPAANPAQRAASLRALPQLTTLADLRLAVALPDWRDADVDAGIAAVDREARQQLVHRFQQAVREALANQAPETQIAVSDMLTDMGVSVRGLGTPHALAREFGPDLARLAAQGNPREPRMRETAARALGMIDADPAVAVPTLSVLLRSGTSRERSAAAEGLAGMIKVAADLASTSCSVSGVRLSRAELIEVGRAVVPAAAASLGDPESCVRRLCLEALGRSASALNHLVFDPQVMAGLVSADVQRQQAAEERTELWPLVAVLREQGPVLARALADPDPEVRALARRTLEVLADLRGRWLRRMACLSERAEDPFLETFRAALPGLVAELRGPARRTATGILEALGPVAAGAVPALMQALEDPDRFVRWGAARALGKIGVPAAAAVPALTHMLGDPDLDLGLAAAAALEQLGPAGRSALPDLMTAVRGSSAAELRLACLRALEAIGRPEAEAAIPVLTTALSDPDARVRLTAAVALGRFGPTARSALEALQRARQDKDADVQQAAATALLQIVQPLPGTMPQR